MTTWKKIEGGIPDTDTYDVSEEMGMEQGSAALVAAVPDWTRHPMTGEKLRVLGKLQTVGGKCSKCGKELNTSTLEIESDRNYAHFYVRYCPDCGYVWFYVNKETSDVA